MASYGTMPGYWGMIGDQYFEQAKTYIFGEDCDTQNTQYAGLIEKINNYHYNVQLPARDMLKRYQAEGMEVYVIAKYGFQNIPVSEEASDPGDDFLELTSSSYGATVSKLGSTFSSDYISAAEANGTAKYISPDKLIDASTCLFPDSTWFIKGLDHKLFPESVARMMITLLNSCSQATVNDYESYPQYLLYDKESDTLSPLTADNVATPEEMNIFKAYINFLRSLFTFLKNFFSSLKAA